MGNEKSTKWSVTKDFHGSTGLIEINIEEALYLGVDSKTSTIIVNTRRDVYFTTGTLRYWTHVLNSSGYHFIVADRTSSVNVSKIVMIDKNLKIAYFDLNDLTCRCTLSKSGYYEVVTTLNQIQASVIFT